MADTIIENKAVVGLNGLKKGTLDALKSFGTSVTAAGDVFPGAPTVAGLVDQVSNQVGNIFTEIAGAASSAGSEVQNEFKMIMRILDPQNMINSLKNLIVGIGEMAAKLWIKLLQEIKKIIRVLWKLFFKELPGWMETILLLIDELAMSAVTILFPNLAQDLSDGEVAYLNEIHAARRITLLEKNSSLRDDN